MRADRCWVAKCRFDGASKPFVYGNIFTRHDAPLHEVEAAAIAQLSEILPPSYPRPAIEDLVPAMLVIYPEVDDDH